MDGFTATLPLAANAAYGAPTQAQRPGGSVQRPIPPMLPEHTLENLAECPRKMHRHPVAQVIRQLVEVPLVRLRQDELHDLAATRRYYLLANATDREHLAGQGQLAGHGEVATDTLIARERYQRSGHGDAGARAILWGRPLGHVQMHQAGLEEVRVTAVVFQVRSDMTVGDLR